MSQKTQNKQQSKLNKTSRYYVKIPEITVIVITLTTSLSFLSFCLKGEGWRET
jgi:hypothetical protein